MDDDAVLRGVAEATYADMIESAREYLEEPLIWLQEDGLTVIEAIMRAVLAERRVVPQTQRGNQLLLMTAGSRRIAMRCDAEHAQLVIRSTVVARVPDLDAACREVTMANNVSPTSVWRLMPPRVVQTATVPYPDFLPTRFADTFRRYCQDLDRVSDPMAFRLGEADEEG